MKRHASRPGEPAARRKPIVQAVEAPRPAPVKVRALPAPRAVEKVLESWWDVEREQCLEMILAGKRKVQVAKELGVARNTVIAWSQHPEFLARLAERQGDVKARRVATIVQLTDRAAKNARKAMRSVADAADPIAHAAARRWADTFMDLRARERTEFGEDVNRKEVAVTGGLSVATSHSVTFRQYIENKIEAGVIDVEALPTDPSTMVMTLLEAAVSDPEIFDAITEADRDK